MPGIIKNIRTQLNDFVFEHRNKDYGAYQLRKSYDRYINRALLIANAGFLFFCSCLFFYYKIISDNQPLYEMAEYKTSDFSLEEVKITRIDQKLPPPPKMPVIENPDAPPVIKDKETDVPKDPKEEKDTKSSQEDGTGKTEVKDNDNTEELKTVSSDTSGKEQYSSEIFMKVEIPAEFPGGPSAFGRFLGENIKYPEFARLNRINGVIYVHMVVNTDGSITELKIYKGIEESCNEEILRVMKSSPNWVPARQKGNFVRQRIIVPIRFKVP